MQVFIVVQPRSSKIQFVAANQKSWQMNSPIAASVWFALVLLGMFAGIRLGFSGRRFATALGVAAALLAFELFLA
ncbi:MAG: hypothetical protein WBP79_07055, partial [Candidatus Acidiferrales bacterium]